MASEPQVGFRPSDEARIKSIISKTKVFMDTSSFMFEKYPELEKILFAAFQTANERLIVPLRVVEELKKHSSSGNIHARYALQSIIKYKNKNLLVCRGEDTDNFADNVFQCQFTRFRMQYALTLITQDVGLACDILKLNESVSQTRAKQISVFRITKYGTLGVNSGDIERQQAARNNGTPSRQNTVPTDTAYKNEQQTKQPNPITRKDTPAMGNKLYCIKKQITSLSDDELPISYIPVEGDTVISVIGKEHIRLTKKIAAGGEGVVYETNKPSIVCKIYSKDKFTTYRLEKLKRMVGTDFKCEGICWPTDVVFNKEQQIVGFLMPKAKGVELQKSLFIPPLLKKRFPNWTKVETVQLCLSILEKIQYLHHHNIIIGDINPLNIMVESPKEVFFVDTDSYQIEEFPCGVGTINFSAPEIQRQNFGTFLRTVENERFAIATLLFMIMHPGKPPYAQQGGEDPISNICKMDFSYPFGTSSNKKTPDGQWRFCWSHLTYKIKEAFYNTFRYDGKYAKPATRLSTKDWHVLFEDYLYLLTSGKFLEQDKMANDLFPTRFKNASNAPMSPCKLCKKEYPEELLIHGYCRNCLNKYTTTPCAKCGQDIQYSNYRKLISQKRPHVICDSCYEKQGQTYTTVKCVDCHKNFSITYGEKEFFEKNNYSLPKRCSVCRKQKAKSGRTSYHRNPPETANMFSLLKSFFNF